MKVLKIVCIIIGVLITIILLDTAQAVVFEASPLISKKVILDSENYVQKGLIIDTYYCQVNDKDTEISWHFKTSKFTCPIENIINEDEINLEEDEDIMVDTAKIKINDQVLEVKLESNSSVEALVKKLKADDITINASKYGDFEVVGSLGFDLPTTDEKILAEPGDVMLYLGNQISVFYDSNSWSYTKLGKITNKTQEELRDLFNNDRVTLVLSIR